ncbi:MAG TPA: TetR/AcrR family transcriptional regulator [Rhizomicrobium sp.]
MVKAGPSRRAGAVKGDKRSRTRRQLIDAAARMIAVHGYEATTLEAVAASVGMSRGAIYGNFKDRDDLFLAVIALHFKPLAPPFRRGATFKAQMRIIGKAVAALVHAPKSRPSLAAEFQLYAETNERLRIQLARLTAKAVRVHANRWLDFLPRDELPLPPRQFIIVVDALIDGLLFQHSLTPKLVTRRLIVGAFEALA